MITLAIPPEHSKVSLDLAKLQLRLEEVQPEFEMLKLRSEEAQPRLEKLKS